MYIYLKYIYGKPKTPIDPLVERYYIMLFVREDTVGVIGLKSRNLLRAVEFYRNFGRFVPNTSLRLHARILLDQKSKLICVMDAGVWASA